MEPFQVEGVRCGKKLKPYCGNGCVERRWRGGGGREGGRMEARKHGRERRKRGRKEGRKGEEEVKKVNKRRRKREKKRRKKGNLREKKIINK